MAPELTGGGAARLVGGAACSGEASLAHGAARVPRGRADRTAAYTRRLAQGCGALAPAPCVGCPLAHTHGTPRARARRGTPPRRPSTSRRGGVREATGASPHRTRPRGRAPVGARCVAAVPLGPRPARPRRGARGRRPGSEAV